MAPADARREIDEAVAAAQSEDRRLRDAVTAVVAGRVEAEVTIEAATIDAAEARALALRALRMADEAARAGQRADTARWSGAAEVFAARLRDARVRVTDAEGRVAESGPALDTQRAALAENVGRLQAVAAARLPLLSGRKAAKAQRVVDEAVAGLAGTFDDLLARAESDALDAVAAREAGEDELTVGEGDLEHELDDAGIDEILHDLRAELGLVEDSSPVGAGAGADVGFDDVVADEDVAADDAAVPDEGVAADDVAADDVAADRSSSSSGPAGEARAVGGPGPRSGWPSPSAFAADTRRHRSAARTLS